MRIILTGGGTAGHINPALAVANAARERYGQPELLYIGAKKGMESQLVPETGIAIEYLNATGLNRKKPWTMLSAGIKAMLAVKKAGKIIDEFKPDVIIGTGGYVCAPTMYAGVKRKIPTVIHEQNAYPGLTVRMLSDKVDAVAIGFSEAQKYLSRSSNVVLTGNPVRQEIFGLSEFEAKAKIGCYTLPLVVMFGGSLGAARMNDALVELLTESWPREYMLIAGTGERNYENVMKRISELGIQTDENTQIVPYITNMEVLLAAADLCVTRAGALTISEICAAGKPSVLIPSPNVSHNHQAINARFLQRTGAAVVIDEDDLNGKMLSLQIDTLLKNEALQKEMRGAAKSIARIHAAEEILDLCERLAQKHNS